VPQFESGRRLQWVVCALRDNVKEIDVNLPIANPDA